MDYRLETISIADAVTLDKAKKQCRVELDETYHDSDITALIGETTEVVSELSDVSITASSYKIKLTGFPKGKTPISVPRGPVSAVANIKYFDTTGTEITISTGINFSDGLIYLFADWPAVSEDHPYPVSITYSAGSVASKRAVRAVLLLIACWYEDPTGERKIPEAVMDLIDQLRS